MVRGRARNAVAVTALAALAVVPLAAPVAAPPPAAPSSVSGFATVGSATAAGFPTGGDPAVGSASGCTDPAGSWLGTRWRAPVRWRFGAASVPGYLGDPSAVRATVVQAAGNVSTARNPCRLTGRLAMAQRYDGGTGRAAAVKPDGGCGTRDGVDEVSFGDLAPGLLAVTCLWWRPGGRGRDGSTVEADILVSARPGLFFLTRPAGCERRWDLEGALTHEFGHVYGLGHVTAAEHPALTMSDALEPCDTSHRGLGLGDYETLRAHY